MTGSIYVCIPNASKNPFDNMKFQVLITVYF